jgi:hypothetical protein
MSDIIDWVSAARLAKAPIPEEYRRAAEERWRMMPDARPRFSTGDRVRHIGTRAVGVVLAMMPYPDGTFEYLVQKDEPLLPELRNVPTWWASYHVFENIVHEKLVA